MKKIYIALMLCGLCLMHFNSYAGPIVTNAPEDTRGFLSILAGGILMILVVAASLISPRRAVEDGL